VAIVATEEEVVVAAEAEEVAADQPTVQLTCKAGYCHPSRLM